MKTMKKPMDIIERQLQSHILYGLLELFDLDYKKLNIDFSY
jgi:hypothetical protein